MKTTPVRQIKVVEASSGTKFQELYNKVAEELADDDVEITIEHKASGHCAYFMYTMHKPEEMSIKDAFSAVGITHKCCECPYLEIGTDARRKTWGCEHSEYGSSHMDSDMCEWAYRMLAKGKLHLRGDEDDDQEDN